MILVDTNFLLAIAIPKDAKHKEAVAALAQIRSQNRIVAAPTLVELAYLVTARADYKRAIQTLRDVRNAFQIEALTNLDMIRIETIMENYQSAEFDYTDAAIMAIAERLKITTIYTFDRRDFLIFRPTHCEIYTLLPN